MKGVFGRKQSQLVFFDKLKSSLFPCSLGKVNTEQSHHLPSFCLLDLRSLKTCATERSLWRGKTVAYTAKQLIPGSPPKLVQQKVFNDQTLGAPALRRRGVRVIRTWKIVYFLFICAGLSGALVF